MDGCWGTSEPTMIDEKILQEAVVDQLPQLQAKHIAKAEGINFSSISKLRLNYRSKRTFLLMTNQCQNVHLGLVCNRLFVHRYRED